MGEKHAARNDESLRVGFCSDDGLRAAVRCRVARLRRRHDVHRWPDDAGAEICVRRTLRPQEKQIPLLTLARADVFGPKPQHPMLRLLLLRLSAQVLLFFALHTFLEESAEKRRRCEMIFREEVMKESFGYLDVNDAARRWCIEKNINPYGEVRPFASPGTAYRMVIEAQLRLGIRRSYGGWGEWRDVVRRGTYLEKKKLYMHTAVDVNSEDGTEVFAIADGKVVHVGTDHPLDGGWGHHVMQLFYHRGRSSVLLYAHLAGVKLPRIGECLKKGDPIGLIGKAEENGNWRPHLHVQIFYNTESTDWARFSREMDGYVSAADWPEWAIKCPDPTLYIFS